MGAFEPSQGNGSDASGVLDGSAVRTNIPDSSLTQTTPNVRDANGIMRSFLPNTRSTSLGQGAVSPFFGSSSVGAYAAAVAQGSTAMGYHALARVAQSCAYGNQAQAQAYRAIAMGSFANANNINSMALGPYAYANFMNSLAVGPGARTSAANQAVFGGEGAGYTDVWFGQGNQVGLNGGTVGNFTIHGEESLTANTAGGELLLAGGRGTGTANGAPVRVQRGKPGSTGTTLNTLFDRLIVGHRKVISNNTTSEIFRVTLPNPSTCQIVINIGVSVTDGTNSQSYSSTASIALVHDAAGYTVGGPTETGVAQALGAGTQAVTLSLTQPATNIEAFNIKSNTGTITPSSIVVFVQINVSGEAVITLV